MNLEGKRVFITGADGFIGSHLAEALVAKGASVKCLVYYNSWNSHGWLSDVDKEVFDELEIVFGDVRDKEHMMKTTEGIDVIFHLSSLISIPYSYDAARSFVDTNVGGALNILTSARANDVEKVLHTSTSEVYGSALYVPIDEKHPLQPQSPYSASKIGADMMALSFYHSFELPVAVVRPFNTYGPRQTPRAIIPTVILQCLRNKGEGKPIKLGTLDTRRDFNFVKDTVGGFIAIAESENGIGEVINIASGEDISIGELVEKIMKLMNIDLPVEQKDERIRPKASEVKRLLGTAEKAKSLCNWQPTTTFEEGLAETIQWFTKKGSKIDADRYWF